MPTLALHPSSTTLETSYQDQRLKLIMFSLQSSQTQLRLGVRIELVDRIIGQAQIHTSQPSLAGILHLHDSDITLLDLQQWLFQTQVQNPQYVIILRADTEQLGIPLSAPPSLIEANAATIRQLPDKYRQLSELKMTTHVVQVVDEDQQITLFLLDPATLYQQI